MKQHRLSTRRSNPNGFTYHYAEHCVGYYGGGKVSTSCAVPELGIEARTFPGFTMLRDYLRERLAEERQRERRFEKVNSRRCELIERKHLGGLSPEEEAELSRLTEETSEYVNRRFPLPDLSRLREAAEQLRETAQPEAEEVERGV